MVETIKTKESTHARLASQEVKVEVTGGFWESILKTNSEVSLLHQYEECERTGRIDNFRRAAELIDTKPVSNRVAPDSDVFKWMEAAAYALKARNSDEELRKKLEGVIDLVVRAQDTDGYLNTVFINERKSERWQNLVGNHELYCGGHLIQAGLAHYRMTGRVRLLAVGVKWADHVCEYFNENNPGTCGHPEVEMALIELYRETKDEKYLKQAIYFIHQRGKKPPVLNGSPYMQDHLPITQQTEVAGHAVRQLYLMSGLADIYLETGEEWILENLLSQYQDLMKSKIAITGGIGARHSGEAFGLPYELPDRTAYNETCSAIAGFMFYWRMLHITGDSMFADMMEQTLYNGILCGVSLDGRDYFYTNPLEHPGDESSIRSIYGSNKRSNLMWDSVPCCPPNLARVLSSLNSYFYTSTPEKTYFHFYAENTARIQTQNGPISLTQKTNYPWDGGVEIQVQTNNPTEHSMMFRIPGWTKGAVVEINGEIVNMAGSGYVEIKREWKNGDVVSLHLPMEVVKMASNSHVTNHSGSVAITRGPIVYCLESVDHENKDIFDLTIPLDVKMEAQYDSELLEGIITIKGKAKISESNPKLYFPLDESEHGEAEMTLIPYFAWANRGNSAMRVWLPIK